MDLDTEPCTPESVNSSTDSSLIVSSARGTPRRQDEVRIVSYERMSRERQREFDELRAFFTEEILRSEVIPIILLRDKVSLRLLDWIVTNFAKKFPDKCQYRLEGRRFPFNIYESYRTTLQRKHKQFFDPFSRDERILFPVDDKGTRLLTTIAQLNFFRWAIERRVLAYARANYAEIEAHMTATMKNRPTNDGKVRRRRELSTAEPRVASTYVGDVSMTF